MCSMRVIRHILVGLLRGRTFFMCRLKSQYSDAFCLEFSLSEVNKSQPLTVSSKILCNLFQVIKCDYYL
uniref:Putative ovule protein n=1 Tax=Solanum chacoense TaxID=4108 RepID=A0A0V0H9L0_SOLCH